MDPNALSLLLREAEEYFSKATPDQRRRLHEKLSKLRSNLKLENRSTNVKNGVGDRVDFLDEN